MTGDVIRFIQVRTPLPTDDELTRYVLDHYRGLLAEQERDIVSAFNLKLKAVYAQNPAISRKLRSARGLVELPHVKAAIDLGYTAARLQIRERVLADHSDTVVLNRCPVCDALCRTPLAKMCPACGHSWHESTNG
ncbi:MAG: hypothetical protein Aurels2KO_26470 [Aureliella sp.]